MSPGDDEGTTGPAPAGDPDGLGPGAARPFERLVGLVFRANGIVAVVLFAALTVVVALQVFTRFVLHAPLIWSEEVGRFLFFWVVLLGSALSVRTRRHFVLDVSPSGGKEREAARSLLSRVFPDLCVLAFAILLLVQGVGYTRIGLLRTATNSRLDMSLVYAAIPVFAALTVLYASANLLQEYAAYRRGEPPPPHGVAAGE